MLGCLDVRLAGQIVGWMLGSVDGWMLGCLDGCLVGCLDVSHPRGSCSYSELAASCSVKNKTL